MYVFVCACHLNKNLTVGLEVKQSKLKNRWNVTKCGPILSRPVLSYPVVSCHIVSYPAASCPVLSFRVLSSRVVSYPVVSRPLTDLSCPVLSLSFNFHQLFASSFLFINRKYYFRHLLFHVSYPLTFSAFQ